MALMVVVGALLMVGLALTIQWTLGAQPADAVSLDDAGVLPPREVLATYARGAAVVLVSGMWVGLLVTGPAIRLIMRLLAVTASDRAQGLVTDADEVVGEISLEGTIGLILFGGILTSLVSAAIYAVVRRWLPHGLWGGATFGALHLVVAATRLDPLRPGNPDFDIVGPPWLAVTLFGATCVLHGIAIAAFAERYRTTVAAGFRDTAARRRVLLPLAIPLALALLSGVFGIGLIAVGLIVVAASRSGAIVRAVHSDAIVVGGRIALALVGIGFLPGAIADVSDILGRSPL